MRLTRGFTLIEMMIVVSILAAIAAYGIPQLNDLIQSSRISSQTNNLHGLVQLARSEAATNRVNTIVCGSTNQTACDTNNWEAGVIVFRDIDGNGSASAAELVRAMPAAANTNTIRSTGGVIRFLTDGTLAAAQLLIVCDERGSNSSRQVRINLSGQARMTRGNAQGDAPCPAI